LGYTFGIKELNAIEEALRHNLIDVGVNCVVLIDMAGNVIAEIDNGETKHDIYSLAALAAGNFGAVSAMAQIVGEDEFSLLFHKGDKECLHFSKIMTDLLLITIFGHDLSLGFLRLKVAETTKMIENILQS